MPAKNPDALKHINVLILAEDDRVLSESAVLAGVVKSRLIRSIIHNYVVHLKDAERQKIDQLPPTKRLRFEIPAELLDDASVESASDASTED